jgi:uncharacterized protein (TIGR02391 family)
MLEHLKAAIPDAEVLLNLEPEELGAKLLFVLRQHGGSQFHFGNLENELDGGGAGQPLYPRNNQAAVGLALREAGAWLGAQGLIIPAQGMNGNNGWWVLTRRARKFQNEAEFANFASARRLPKETLHPRISTAVWTAFMRNEFDVAVFQATKAVEVAVREAARLESGDIGVKLMRKAFDVDSGPLTDLAAERSERQALSDMFAGAIGTYKNPHSHRDVELTDPVEATEIVMLANLLLRIVDARAAARNAQ